MAVNLQPTVERVVNFAWNSFLSEIEAMGGQARPKHPSDVFSYGVTDEGYLVTLAPITLRLKEKAAASECVLFVTVEGCLLFPRNAHRNDMRVVKYQTRAGYFRVLDGGKLKHVYGVHYDHDDDLPAHPVYHSQMSTMASFVQHVNAAWNAQYQAIEPDLDLMKGLLRNVRIPTAHMDPFSVLLQIASDHLVSEVSDAQVTSAYDRLRGALSTFRSSRDGAVRLDAAIDQHCFRSGHWYR
ncbi:MAG: hypothetical protein QOG72_1063 [Sphingomonadales bacterium]|jgi:hypothetical protein|nr:hypothetical protein [Sphingomonadales bacterium]